jgi:hypothetical protein
MPGLYTRAVLHYLRKLAVLLYYVIPPTAAKNNRTGILNEYSSMYNRIIFILAQNNISVPNARAVH